MKDITRFAHVPEDIISLPRWVLWRYEMRTNSKGEPRKTKVPYHISGRYRASSTKPTTWTTYTNVLELYRDEDLIGREDPSPADGIGFMLGNGWAGVDLDDCIVDGRISAQAQQIIASMGTYTEISPSGNGVKMIARGELPPGRRRIGKIEMYDRGRFFSITGNEFKGAA